MYVSYEQNKQTVFGRILCSTFGVEKSKLVDLRNRQEMTEKIKNIKSKVAIEHLPEGSSVSALETLIENYLDKVNPNLDFLAVDYLGCLTSTQSGPKDSLYDKFGYVISELNLLAEKYNIAIVSAVQLNRDGYKKEAAGLGMDSVADSIKIMQKAHDSFIMTVAEDGLERIVQIKYAKARQSAYSGTVQHFRMDKLKCQLLELSKEEEAALQEKGEFK
jgi:replicative DNA helicase